MGFLASARVPRFLLRPAIVAYCKHFDVDLAEAALPISDHRRFNEFFARALRDGARPLDADPAAVLSPVDGRVHAAGAIEAGQVLQAKGVPYSVGELLGSDDDAREVEGGTFATLYLSPRDYHRIHWPLDASVERVRHLPGDLWPVNDRAVAGVPRLFARNERVALFGRTATGGRFAFVCVGALNVGSIVLAPGLASEGARTNGWSRRRVEWTKSPPLAVRRGDELGRFEFGSAVVLLLAPGAGRLDTLETKSPVRVGRRIGTLSGAPR